MGHDIETATNGHDSRNGKPMSAALRETRAKDRISHFTWAWFACTMSTGAIAVVLGQMPCRFKGLDTIGKIFFLLDLILFILFSILISIRFGMRPLIALRSLHHPGEALFFGAFWVSVALIINCIEIYGGPSTGPWLTKALEICFWSYAACAFCVAVFQYATLFVSERFPVSSAMPAWVFPAYPFLVIGPLAGVLIPSQPPEAALPMFVGAVMLQGLGWVISMCMYSIYIQRLMGSELPPPPSRPGMYISVGPVGYTATGLVSLGVQATSVIPADFLLVSSVDVGEVVKILGVLSGMFLVLLAVWFFSLSTVAILEDVKDMSFTLNWWAFIFPNAGMILALIQIGKVLQNKPIKVITSVMTVTLVAMWFFVAVSHVLAVQKKLILWEGKDEDAGMDLDPTPLRKRRRVKREQENERQMLQHGII